MAHRSKDHDPGRHLDEPEDPDGYDGLTHILTDSATSGGVPLCGTQRRPLVHGGINVASCMDCQTKYFASPDAMPLCRICGFRHRGGDDIACGVLAEMRGGTLFPARG